MRRSESAGISGQSHRARALIAIGRGHRVWPSGGNGCGPLIFNQSPGV